MVENQSKVKATALKALELGLSVIPISADGSKSPALVSWEEYQERQASFRVAANWFNTNPRYGLGLVCGKASKNLELFEFDDLETYQDFKAACQDTGIYDLFLKVYNGYSEQTPGNGIHLWYYCPEVEIPGSTVLAARPIPETNKQKVLIETRGKGGQGVIAPSNGTVHPTGKAYKVLMGGIDTIATITAKEREALWNLARTFDEVEIEETTSSGNYQTKQSDSEELRPGDDFDQRADWESDVLGQDGWKVVHRSSKKTLWLRPGKVGPGCSASTGYVGRSGKEVFCNYSSSVPNFAEKRGYTKFQTYAILYHGGDYSAAAKELAGRGYGTQKEKSNFKPFRGERPKNVDPETGEVLDFDRPELFSQEGDLTIITPMAWDVLYQYNKPPKLFTYASRVQRFQKLEERDRRWALQEVSEKILRYEVTRAAWWYKLDKDGKKVSAIPSKTILENMLSQPEISLPILTKVVETPVFSREGKIIQEPGYDQSGIYYNPVEGLEIKPISEKPTGEEVDKALSLVYDLIYDFPFVDEKEKINAIAIFIEPFVRDMINGPTPLRLIEASTPGTGKGLLADAITRHANGQPGLISQCQNDEEWNKSIISQLRSNASVVLIDNINTTLDSSALAGVLTSEIYGGRLLGTNDTVQYPNRALWLATGNNPTMTTEIARRTVRIRLDAKTDRPWQREGFKHEDLRGWADAHRSELIWAAMTLVQNWISKGQKPFTGRFLGSFESWSKVLGGVLDAAGLVGFLENLDEFYEAADSEGTALRNFVNIWWAKFSNRKTAIGDLFNLASEFDSFDLGSGNERSQRIRFGSLVKRQKDRVISGYTLHNGGIKDGSQMWFLNKAGMV